MRKTIVSVILAVVLTAAPAVAAPYTKLVVFGDSLVDAGNAYIGSHFTTAQPAYGYFAGRYSNGPAWTDLVEQRLNGNLTKPFLLGGDNLAVGGAQAAMDRNLQGFVVPGLASQLGLFAQSGKTIDPNAVYVLNFGNNDVSALDAGLTAAPTAAAKAAFRAGYTAAFVGNYVGAVTSLNAAGARHFLIGGVPNPTNPEGVALEVALQGGFAGLNLAPGTSFVQLDYFRFFDHLVRDPVGLGLPADIDTDLSHACVNIYVAPTNPTPNCSHFLSFDGIHPTAPVHVALARYAEHLLGVPGVPEPGSWALLVTGFGLIGMAVRRKRVSA